MAVQISPYLAFKNNAKEAMEFYEGIFGGKLSLTTFGEGMGDGAREDNKDLIMHGALEADGFTLMGSDAMKVEDITAGTNVSISLSGDDGDRLKKYFDALGESGTVSEPLTKAPWGDEFGMVTDKYGFHWMVNIISAENA